MEAHPQSRRGGPPPCHPPIGEERSHLLADLQVHLLPVLPQVPPDKQTGVIGILQHVLSVTVHDMSVLQSMI